MNDAFELLDPRNAQAFLKSFESEARRKGEAHFLQGHVHELTAEEPGMAYSAVVKDGRPYEVYLQYDPVEGWSGDCSCPTEFDCEHVFAALRALLAEHSTASVRSLSAGTAGSRREKRSKEDGESGGLARRVMAARRRPLGTQATQLRKAEHDLGF